MQKLAKFKKARHWPRQLFTLEVSDGKVGILDTLPCNKCQTGSAIANGKSNHSTSAFLRHRCCHGLKKYDSSMTKADN